MNQCGVHQDFAETFLVDCMAKKFVVSFLFGIRESEKY